MLNVTDHQRNANLNQNEIPSTSSEWLSSINQQITSAGEDMEKGEQFCAVGGNGDWCRHCGKQYGVSLKIQNGTS